MEKACIGAPLGCIFSLEFGWEKVAQRTATSTRRCHPPIEAKAAILASNYGEAAFVDIFENAYRPRSAATTSTIYGARATTMAPW